MSAIFFILKMYANVYELSPPRSTYKNWRTNKITLLSINTNRCPVIRDGYWAFLLFVS